jgi:predicted nuclease with TOPRIM domain
MNRPENRKDIVKKRRDIIKAEYQLDILRERLEEREGEYTKASEKLNTLAKSNGAFQSEFAKSLCELNSTVNRLWNDTLR